MTSNSVKKPLVSVVMPAWNAELYIKQAIESILAQTFTDFELIIVEDCSTDATLAIINEYGAKDSRVKVFRNEHNLKLSRTLNLGIKKAQGKYIARMDADDISLPNRLQLQVDVMEKDSTLGVLGGSMQIVNQNDKKVSLREYYKDDKDIRKHIFMYSPFCHPTIMIRKSVFDQTDGYNQKFWPAEDYDLYFKLGRFGKFGNLKDILLNYRIVDNSMTTGKLRQMELQTIKVRFNYFREYHGTLFDLVYIFLQISTMYLMPAKVRIYLFAFFRGKFL